MTDIISQYIERNHFGIFLGMNFKITSPGNVEYYLPIQKHHLATPKYVHGGCLSALADACMGVGALSLSCDEQKVVSTIEFKISFFEAVTIGEHLVALSEVKKDGKSIVFMEASIYNESKDIVALATGTFKKYNAEKAGYLLN